MTYAQESLALARSLARLLDGAAGELDTAGYQQALLARAATLALAGHIHADVVGARKPRARSAAAVEADAVAELGHALARHPRVSPSAAAAPSIVLGQTSATSAGREWGAAARHAIVAAHDWGTARPRWWSPSAAWTAVADASALAEGIARLDGDLAAAALRLGRVPDAEQLAAAAVAGLRTAATEVASVARSGPLDPGATEREARARRTVLQVGAWTDVPPAQAQLVHLLCEASHVRPEHAVQVAIGQARGARAAARVLRAVPETHPGRSDLHRVAEALDAVVPSLVAHTRAPGTTASPYRGDLRPLHQAGELVRFLEQQPSGPPDAGNLRAAVRYAAQVPDTTLALSQVGVRETDHERWLVRSRGDVAAWVPAGPDAPAPPLLDALRSATSAARAVTREVERLPAELRSVPVASTAAVWTTLAGALTSRPLVRPHRPSERPPGAMGPLHRQHR